MKLLVLAMAALVHAEVLDRVAVSIGSQVITESQLIEEIRLDAFLNNEPPSFTESSKRTVAGRLVDQKLVRKEMEMGRYPSAVPAEAEAMIENLTKTRRDFDKEINAAGITLPKLREHLLWGLTLSHFVDLRFRPAVQVTAGDVERYYKEKIGPNVPLSDVRARILETLEAERSDAAVEAWLKDARAHTNIEFQREVFGESGSK
jgi:hypothetical protein